jgi:hypothetical protein
MYTYIRILAPEAVQLEVEVDMMVDEPVKKLSAISCVCSDRACG